MKDNEKNECLTIGGINFERSDKPERFRSALKNGGFTMMDLVSPAPTPPAIGGDRAAAYALSVVDRLEEETKVRSDIHPMIWGTIRAALASLKPADAKPAPGITRKQIEALRFEISPEIDKTEAVIVRVAKFNSFHMGKNATLDAVLALFPETTALGGGAS